MSVVSDKAIIKALNKRKKAEEAGFDVTSYLFPEQLAFIQDPSPNKLAVCPHRS